MSSSPSAFYYELGAFLDKRREHLLRSKIDRWIMTFHSEAGLNIEDCRGGRISYSGIRFSDTARDVYWEFLNPCIRDTVDESFAMLDSFVRQNEHLSPEQAVQETEALLRQFIAGIMKRMVDIDRRLRGNGYPLSVQPYDTTGMSGTHTSYVAHRAVAARELYVPLGFVKRSAAFLARNKQMVAVITASIGLLGTAIALLARLL